MHYGEDGAGGFVGEGGGRERGRGRVREREGEREGEGTRGRERRQAASPDVQHKREGGMCSLAAVWGGLCTMTLFLDPVIDALGGRPLILALLSRSSLMPQAERVEKLTGYPSYPVPTDALSCPTAALSGANLV